jgi:hypothetical protein
MGCFNTGQEAHGLAASASREMGLPALPLLLMGCKGWVCTNYWIFKIFFCDFSKINAW